MIWRVLLGTFSIVLTMVVLGYVAVTEQDRMASFETAYNARQVEVGAALYESNCQNCHGARGEGIQGPPLSTADLVCGTRLKAIGWGGTVQEYLRGVITSGRPRASAEYQTYPQRMPAWGQDYGGPMRRDQIESLVAYIMNWAAAYQDESGNCVAPEPTVNPDAVGADISVELPEGDATNGAALVQSLGCVACHVAGANTSAPAWEAATSADAKSVAQHAEERFQASDYTGAATSPELYLLESIIDPNAYIVPPGAAGTWPAAGPSTMAANNYDKRLTKQEVADLIAYLLTVQ